MEIIKRQSSEKGFVLTLVTVMVVILVATGLGLLRLGMNARVRAARTTADTAAKTAADAGLTKALFELNELLQIKPWNDSDLPSASGATLANSDQSYSFSVDTNDYTITSVGVTGTSSRTVTANLGLTNGMYEYAIFADSGLSIAMDSLVDAVNSDISLDPNDTSGLVKIGTNGTGVGNIQLTGDIIVDGDVLVGPNGDPETVIHQGVSVNITGTEEALINAAEFESITVPTYPIQTDISVAAGDTAEITANGEYGAISLGIGATLTITGNVELYVTGNVSLQMNGTINVAENSSLILYLDGNLSAAKNSGINNTPGIPSNLRIYGTSSTSQTISLKKDADFLGAIYAPNATVNIDKAGDIYGSIVCDTFSMDKGSEIYYDEALRDNVDVNDIRASFYITRWQE